MERDATDSTQQVDGLNHLFCRTCGHSKTAHHDPETGKRTACWHSYPKKCNCWAWRPGKDT